MERDGLVLLTMVLPDDVNRGYEGARLLLVDQINGHTISNMTDVRSALKSPTDGFHHIHFVHDEGLRHIVMGAADLATATDRILRHYRIPQAESL